MTPAETRDRVSGALLGLALGDAMGAPYEGGPPGMVAATVASDRELIYTDDTEMAIGVAEALLHDPEIDPDFLATRFVSNHTARRGYGWGTRRWVEMVAAGATWQAAGRTAFPEGSFGNGAAMRVAPVGLVHAGDAERRRAAAERSARVTHQHPLGVDGAVLVAHAVALAFIDTRVRMDGASLLEALAADAREGEYQRSLGLAKSLLKKPFDPDRIAATLGNGIEAHRSVPSAILVACQNSDDFGRAVRAAFSLGGDTDTIGAMTGAIVGAHVGRSGLPEDDVMRLENLERLVELADLLTDAVSAAAADPS